MTETAPYQVDTGHHESCVCGHCSQVRQECTWPTVVHDRATGRFKKVPIRYGHDWHAGPGVFLDCPNCDKRAVFGIVEHAPGPGEREKRISTVRLA